MQDNDEELPFRYQLLAYALVALISLPVLYYWVLPSVFGNVQKIVKNADVAERRFNDYQDCTERMARQGWGRNDRQDYCKQQAFPQPD